jgi:hypothetical protein
VHSYVINVLEGTKRKRAVEENGEHAHAEDVSLLQLLQLTEQAAAHN